MSGLNFSLGGKLDPSYAASLRKAESEAKAAGLRIQNSLRARITALDATDPTSPGYAAAMEKKARLQNQLLVAQNAQFLSSAKSRIAAREAEGAAIAAQTGKIAGLNLVLRESLVLLREWGRGNYSRMPGSASLIAQGLAQMGAMGKFIAFLNKPLMGAGGGGALTALTSIPLVALGALAASLTAIIAAPFIYLHRQKTLTEELRTSFESIFNPEHIAKYKGKLSEIANLEKDLADEAWRTVAAHDSVAESINRELDLTRDRIRFEAELLELQKANELARTRSPAEREAIEKKYSDLILSKKKEERDAELRALKDEAARLPGEMAGYENQIKGMTADGSYIGKEREQQILEKLKSENAAAEEYLKQVPAGEKDARQHSIDKDRALLEKYHVPINFSGSDAELGQTLTDKEIALVRAAQGRIQNANQAKSAFNQFVNAGDDRERARAHVKELEDMVKADQKRLTELVGSGKGNGKIADMARMNLQKDAEDLAVENERLKRTGFGGGRLGGREVTERERIGLGSPSLALLDVNKSMDRKLGILVQHAQRSVPGSGVWHPAHERENMGIIIGGTQF